MKVALHIVEARREQLAALLKQHRYLSVAEVSRRLKVSEATARRDLASLKKEKKITRTHGGALVDFDDRFPSFSQRRNDQVAGKRKIGRLAAALCKPGGTYYLDCGTTIYVLAEILRASPRVPLTIVTCSLPVGELLAEVPGVKTFLLGGQVLHRQSLLSGEVAQRNLEPWTFDTAFLSAEAMDRHGIWNSNPVLAGLQKSVLERSRHHVFCIDRSKLGRNAPHFLLPWREVDAIASDASAKNFSLAGAVLKAKQRLVA